ncbi:hypothetical protein O3G_MSEX004992 [Manduca sexta]|uniref:TIL domain-containing protein n=1 Tax=Manduca sexta TaxID=7130 RepID=A0A921YY99_MANSE|nr:hypothetical protein O3G_MSEX004992 [Manduca sexta]
MEARILLLCLLSVVFVGAELVQVGMMCGSNERLLECGCPKTCRDPVPECKGVCRPGCYCEDGQVRNATGHCVKLADCPPHSYIPQPIPYRIMCGPLQRYRSCETCEKTCSNPNPPCPMPCKKGCFCDPGYVRAPSGDCVKLNECPKAEVTLGGAHDPTVEDCASDEEFLSCGWCEPSCSDPAPICPVGVCTRGCLCRPPLLRHRSGHCVQEKDCLPHKCTEPNEEYVCRYGCEPRCDRPTCTVRPRRCALGCHCRLGYLRDITTGLCVTSDNCTRSDAVISVRN